MVALLSAMILALIVEDFPVPGFQGLSLAEVFALVLLPLIPVIFLKRRFRFALTNAFSSSTLIFLIITALLIVAEIIHLSLARGELNAGVGAFEHLTRRLLGLAVIISALTLDIRESSLRTLVGCVIALATLQALSIILGVTWGVNFHPERFAASRIGIFDIQSASLGVISTKGMVAIIFSAAALGVLNLKGENTRSFVFKSAFLLLLLFASLLSGSRSIFFSLVIAFVTFFIARRSKFDTNNLSFLALAVGVLLVLFLQPISEFFNAVILRDGSEGRLVMGLQALDMYIAHPLFGIGPHQRIFQMYVGGEILENGSHNLILQALLYGGVVGAAWIAALLRVLWIGVRVDPAKNLPLVLAFLLPSMFFQPLQSAFVSWSLMFAVIVYSVRCSVRHTANTALR